MTTETRSPTNGSNDNAVGTVSWSGPTLIYASDNSRAVNPRGTSGTTYYLKASAFGFEIPDATINGIKVEIELFGGVNDVESQVKIVKADGSIGGTNRATGANLPTVDTYVSYGGSSDLWGETWSATDINDADFGVVVSVVIAVGGRVYVDHIQITIYYTEGGAPAFVLHSLSMTGCGI